MTRLARMVLAGVPHLVTQRGNFGHSIFSDPADGALYRDIMAERCKKAGVEVWAYCLMPNHVHLIMQPETVEGITRAVGEAHRRYAAFVNARAERRGHLFHGRFSAIALDEPYVLSAARYVLLNPVRAKLVPRAQDWKWSSMRAHIAGKDDELVSVEPLREYLKDIAAFTASGPEDEFKALRASEGIGRPLGSPEFMAEASRQLGRSVIPAKRGPKPKKKPETEPVALDWFTRWLR